MNVFIKHKFVNECGKEVLHYLVLSVFCWAQIQINKLEEYTRYGMWQRSPFEAPTISFFNNDLAEQIR